MILRNILCLTLLVCGTSSGRELPQAREAGGKTSSKKTPHRLPKSDPAGADIMRFDNGDLIHGNFGGLNGGILWKRPDMDQPLRVRRDGIRQIVFNGGVPEVHSGKSSFVSLINGDQIPGKIKSLSDKHLVLDSQVIGEVTIPRELIKALAPNPFNGHLSYAGPFTSDGWVLLTYPEIEKSEKEDDEEEASDEEEEPEKPDPGWIYSGAAFFNTRDAAPLAFQTELPDKGRLQFDVSWKGRLSLNVALHADFTRPIIPEIVPGEEDDAEENEEAAKEEDAKEDEPAPLKHETLWDLKEGNALQSVPWLQRENTGHSYTFGNSYVLHYSGSYPYLYRCDFDENGKAKRTSLSGPRSPRHFPESGSAHFDIRFDKEKKLFILFIDGKYTSQWTDENAFNGTGSSIGFSSQGNCRIRLSDIYITSWNGMRDTALSMEHAERDVALLTNGTDRLSGMLTRIENGIAHLKTSYTEMAIPLNDISSLKLKKSTRNDLDDEKFEWQENEPSILLFKPLGRLSIDPKDSTEKKLNGHSPFLGNLKVNLNSATLLRFNDESSDVTDWFDDL